jgi:hypothetical protein
MEEEYSCAALVARWYGVWYAGQGGMCCFERGVQMRKGKGKCDYDWRPPSSAWQQQQRRQEGH